VQRLSGHVETRDAAFGHGRAPQDLDGAPLARGIAHFGQIARREDVVAARTQVLIDQDPAPAVETRGFGELHLRKDAERLGHQVAGDPLAVFGLDAHDSTVLTEDPGEFGKEVDLHPLCTEPLLDDVRFGV
jgi:hypothetical protein